MTGEEYRKIRETITNEDIQRGKIKIILYPWDELVQMYGEHSPSRISCPRRSYDYVTESLLNKISGKAKVTGLSSSGATFPPAGLVYIPLEFIQSIGVDSIYSVPPELQKVVDYV
jgi:hypothetical protein